MTDDAVYAAVAWDEHGFEIATTAEAPRTVRAASAAEVRHHLLQLQTRHGARLLCVVDSTDGMLDGGLLDSGLRVARADPGMLPARPRLGSVPAPQLAAAAAARPDLLVALAASTGTLTGRPDVDDTDATAAEIARLVAAGRCVQAGPARNRTVALTFDDGPHPPYTDRVLDTLARYGVPATFFCVGLHARTHRDTVRRIVDEGHRLGNHTYSHCLLADLDVAQVRAQLERTDEALGEVGSRRLFRPPYGAVDAGFVRRFAADPAERSMVLWDVDTGDWARPGAATIAERAVRGVRPGSVVLLHDGGGDRSQTVEALPRIVETLAGDGYAFVTADALFPPASANASSEFAV